MLTIQEIKNRTAPVFKRYGIRTAYLFGSYAHGEATEHSDVDIRVDLPDNLRGLQVPGFYADTQDALGYPLDIMTTRQLDKTFLSFIRPEEIKIYDFKEVSQ